MNYTIPDKDFKALSHCYKRHKMHLNGGELEKGYKPDFVLVNGNDFVILECENASSRKTFVGGLMKAAYYLQGEKTGILIFVIVERKNTTVISIAKHLKKYLLWIQQLSNLKSVFVIEASHYYNKNGLLKIGSRGFEKMAVKV